MRKRRAALMCSVLACGAVGLAVASARPVATGCTTHQCDQSFSDAYPTRTLDGGTVIPGGFMLDETTYVTNGLDDPWLPFPGNRTITVWFPKQVTGWIPDVPVVETGTSSTPNSVASRDAGANYIQAVGQLAIFNVLNTDQVTAPNGYVAGGQLSVTNSSCATYFARITVHFFIPTDAGNETSSPLDNEMRTEADAGSD